jgi:hypothetical protein
MRVLVIGSNRFEKDLDSTSHSSKHQSEGLFKAASQVGSVLAKKEHTILICSEAPDTADYYILQGAKEAAEKVLIEKHIPNNETVPSEEGNNQKTGIKLKRHLTGDIQVVHMETMAQADALIIMGGSTRSVRTGVAAFMLGKTVIPVGSFGGAGLNVWAYASSKREEFYKGGLSDAEIDKLAEEWSWDNSAEFVVEAVEQVRKAIVKTAIPRFVLSGAILIMLLAMASWVVFIAYGYNLTGGGSASAIGPVFAAVCFAGLIGSSLKSLLDVRNGRRISRRDLGLDVALGIGAGFVSAMLYLVLQVAVTGKAESIESKNDYVRVALLVSLVAVFAAMYLDAAFANFDTVKGSILTGEVSKQGKK